MDKIKISPFKGRFRISQNRHSQHGGLDLVALDDRTVYSITSGIVEYTGFENNGFGEYVRVRHNDGTRMYYGHLVKGSTQVKQGQPVAIGCKIGIEGTTGKSTGLHLHIEMRGTGYDKKSLDINQILGTKNNTGGVYMLDEKQTLPENIKQWIADNPDAIYYITQILTFVWDNRNSL